MPANTCGEPAPEPSTKASGGAGPRRRLHTNIQISRKWVTALGNLDTIKVLAQSKWEWNVETNSWWDPRTASDGCEGL